MTDRLEDWSYDDPEIVNHSVLYRRVPEVPNFTERDLITGEVSFLKGAFQYGEGGLSVSRLELLQRYGLTEQDALREGQLLAAFTAESPRRGGGGVVDTPGHQEPWMKEHLHRCHSAVRSKDIVPDKKTWNNIREEILRDAFHVKLSPKS